MRENTVYCGFRWLFIDRNLDPHIIHNIEPTKQTKIQNLGYIAKLNSNKSIILTIYLDRKTAAHLNGYASSSRLDTPIKNNNIVDGYFYTLYDNCEQYLKDAFEEKHGNILLYKDGIGQFDINNTLIQEFVCKYDCTTKLAVGQKAFVKALDKNILYKEWYFKTLGSKLSI